jgi:hypothetical protein
LGANNTRTKKSSSAFTDSTPPLSQAIRRAKIRRPMDRHHIARPLAPGTRTHMPNQKRVPAPPSEFLLPPLNRGHASVVRTVPLPWSSPGALFPFNTLSGQNVSSVFITNVEDSEAGNKGPPVLVMTETPSGVQPAPVIYPFLVSSRAQNKLSSQRRPLLSRPFLSRSTFTSIRIRLCGRFKETNSSFRPALVAGTVSPLVSPCYMNPLSTPVHLFLSPLSSSPTASTTIFFGRPRRHSFLHFKSYDLRSRNSEYCH